LKSLLVVVFILASALGAGAQEPGPATQTVTGTVLSSGNVSFALTTGGGRQMSFMVLTDTELPPTAISAGETVTVSYRPLDAERLGARTVTRWAADARPAATSFSAAATTAADEDDRAPTWALVLFVAMTGLGLASVVRALVGILRAQGRRHRTV
jgi:hypothetical protein